MDQSNVVLRKMVKRCCVKSCRSKPDEKCTISYHRFPRSKIRRQQWLDALNIDEHCLKFSARVCSNHFRPTSYIKGCRHPQLTKYAIPVLEYPSICFVDVGDTNDNIIETEIPLLEETILEEPILEEPNSLQELQNTIKWQREHINSLNEEIRCLKEENERLRINPSIGIEFT